MLKYVSRRLALLKIMQEEAMNLKDLIKDINCEYVKGNPQVEISGISYDSRNVKDGHVFICISGYKTDGHKYIRDAADKGAAAIVIEKDADIPPGMTAVKVEDTRTALGLLSAAYFNYPAEELNLIGITGTNGKTTTTYLIKSILDEYGKNTALLGTISNVIGGERVEAKRTTPESYDLQEMFYEMKKAHTQYCVMEVSSHSLELKRVAGCLFNVGVFTNLTRDHLDFHETFENYLNAKIKLFRQSKTAVINIDDSYADSIINNINIPVISYSQSRDADVTASDIEITSLYSQFILRYDGNEVLVKLPLPGRFNVYNALAAAAACLREGVPMDTIKKGLENVKGVPGRSEVIDSGRGFTIIIDYAHTPDGLVNILNTVNEYAKGRIITLFGCGGDRDKTKRPEMGEAAGHLSDLCIVTSDNPRTEDPLSIINDILPGIKKVSSSYEVIADRKEAIRRALAIAQKDDIVVIAGKGHENYQVLKDKTIHFDEREIVRDILNNMD